MSANTQQIICITGAYLPGLCQGFGIAEIAKCHKGLVALINDLKVSKIVSSAQRHQL